MNKFVKFWRWISDADHTEELSRRFDQFIAARKEQIKYEATLDPRQKPSMIAIIL